MVAGGQVERSGASFLFVFSIEQKAENRPASDLKVDFSDASRKVRLSRVIFPRAKRRIVIFRGCVRT